MSTKTPPQTPAKGSTQPEFVAHCLDLLASTGPCVAKRMFGGWGISTGGLTLAIIADLGCGECLWLKADATTLPTFEAAGWLPAVCVHGQRKAHDAELPCSTRRRHGVFRADAPLGYPGPGGSGPGAGQESPPRQTRPTTCPTQETVP